MYMCRKCIFSWKKSCNRLPVYGIVVPLHPQTRNKGSREGPERVSEARRETVLWHNSIDRNCSTRETSTNRHSEKNWRVILGQSSLFIPYYIYRTTSILSNGRKILYNEEFDPGSGWTLATGLTHASRGAALSKLALIDGDRRTGA